MKSSWFVIPKPRPQAQLRLFCFPYAGGNTSTYVDWANKLSQEVELVLILPPGRATRIVETAFDDMSALVSDLFDSIIKLLDKPYILLGHSLGSRVAFELLSRLQTEGYSLPEALIASGSRAPHLKKEFKDIWQMSDQEFIDELKILNGTPKAFFDHPELIEFLLPMLRADFKIADLYRAEKNQLNCSIHVLSGTEDSDIPKHELMAWQDLSLNKITLNYIHGDHFFIDKNPSDVLSQVNRVLSEIMEADKLIC